MTSWDWAAFQRLPSEDVTVDLHCVTKWSKFGTRWRGVSLDTLLADVETAAEFALARSYGGYTTNLPLADLLDGQAWIAYRYDGERPGARARRPGPAAGPAPVPVEVGQVGARDRPDGPRTSRGSGRQLGYHNYGDPWREQRYWGD